MTHKVLVYGWYGRGNIGDELMLQALKSMFAAQHIDVEPVDRITKNAIEMCDGVVFGGGGILDGRPSIDTDALDTLLRGDRPTFYMGIGHDSNPHEVHQRLLASAQIVLVRSPIPSRFFPQNTHVVPDLAYYLPVQDPPRPVKKGVLVIPNMETLPTWDKEHWRHVAWEHFKDEFAQFLDVLHDGGVRPTFLCMCKNPRMDDQWAAHELIARMKNRSTKFDILHPPADSRLLTGLMQEFEVVVTQRYHGIVLAQMAGVPCISIAHHDKLKNAWPRNPGVDITYYEASKNQFVDAFETAKQLPRESSRHAKELYDGFANIVAGVIRSKGKSRVEQIRGGT